MLSALFAPELGANELQAFLIGKESARVYNLCCSVAGLLSTSKVIYYSIFMISSYCKEDELFPFVEDEVLQLLSYKLSAVVS